MDVIVTALKIKKVQNLILDDINRGLKIELNSKKDVSLEENMERK